MKFLRGPGRREIGHGVLAERSLREMLPAEEGFPYTIRIVSDILESNGSSSMATVCGGTLALMDAGVPIKSPVAGVAMGLVMDGDRAPGPHRHRGRGRPLRRHGLQGRRHPRPGSPPCRWTSRWAASPPTSWRGALEQARAGRLHILDRMLEALAQPRTDISPYAPRILTIRVPVDKIRDIIGPGGKMIRSIVERTGCKIDVEDDGRVSIASVDESAARKAIAIIEELTATPELNKSYLGKVVRVVEFGAFVEILPGTDGLLHVSEMAHHRVNNVHDEVKEGDQVLVKVVSIDPSGKIRLSRKALLDEAQGGAAPEGGSGGGEGHGGPGGSHAHGRPRALRRPGARPGPRSAARRRSRARRPRRAGATGPGTGPAGLNAVRHPGLPGLTLAAAARRGGRRRAARPVGGGQGLEARLRALADHRAARGDDPRRPHLGGREHCFAIDALRVEKRIVPGRPTRVDLTPERAGVFPFYCCLESGKAAEVERGQLTVSE